MTQMYKTFFKAQNKKTIIFKIKKGAQMHPQTDITKTESLWQIFVIICNFFIFPKSFRAMSDFRSHPL